MSEDLRSVLTRVEAERADLKRRLDVALEQNCFHASERAGEDHRKREVEAQRDSLTTALREATHALASIIAPLATYHPDRWCRGVRQVRITDDQLERARALTDHPTEGTN